jgi:hypothetical protein
MIFFLLEFGGGGHRLACEHQYCPQRWIIVVCSYLLILSDSHFWYLFGFFRCYPTMNWWKSKGFSYNTEGWLGDVDWSYLEQLRLLIYERLIFIRYFNDKVTLLRMKFCHCTCNAFASFRSPE